jgi:hypothetical protein
MMIAEVNITIGAIDRILKMTKDGKSNNRELINDRVELDHWRARHQDASRSVSTAKPACSN